MSRQRRLPRHGRPRARQTSEFLERETAAVLGNNFAGVPVPADGALLPVPTPGDKLAVHLLRRRQFE